MKTLKIITLLISLFLVSCNGDSSGEESSFFIKGTVDDVVFSSTFNQVIFTNSFEPPYKLLDFTGIDDDDNAIRVTVSSYLEPGTYNLPDVNHPLLGFEFQLEGSTDIWVASTNHPSTTGVLNVTEENGTIIKGSFSFNAINTADNSTKQITDGHFFIKK